MLDLLSEILEVNGFALGEMTRKIICHPYVAFRILHQKLKAKNQLHNKDAYQVDKCA